MSDPYLGTCVVCGRDSGKQDFCADCIERDEHLDQFGRCYQCRDFHDHEHCVGVPCQCPCPTPDVIAKQKAVDEVLAKLTPAERAILGF